ncbi:MAG: hypothetical protein H6559_34220 [Lewinellaceae bacterium]|nr:hypothetical protein [Lewinellaceae bacterium]
MQPSYHPISQQLAAFLEEGEPDLDETIYQPVDWEEQVGKGVQGIVCQRRIKVGSRQFVDHFLNEQCPDGEGVYVQVNHELRGCFRIDNHFREGAWNVARYFGEKVSPFSSFRRQQPGTASAGAHFRRQWQYAVPTKPAG